MKRRRDGKCSRCGEARDMGGQRYCKKCHAEYMRRWRKSHPLTGEARFKDNARSKTNTYIARGLIIKGPCEVCGTTEKVQAHHDDYERWKEVRWLCPFHHRKHHREENL